MVGQRVVRGVVAYIDGMPRSRQIFRANKSGTSVWRGTWLACPLAGLRQIEWLPPSRTNTQPWCWRWLMRRRRLATLHRYQQFFAVALGLRVGLIIFPSHIQEHWNHVR